MSEEAPTAQPVPRPLTDRLARHHGSIRSIAAIVGGNATAAAVAAVGGLLTARFVGPETAGEFRSFTIPLMYLVFLHLGTFDGLYRQIPLYIGKERRDLVEAAASSAGAWNAVVSLVISAAFILLAGRSVALGDLHGALGWAAQGVLTWGVLYGGFLGATYRTVDHFVALSRIQTLQSILSFAFVFTLPVLGFYGLCLRSAIPSFVGTWLFHRARPIKVPLELNRKPFLDIVRVGLPFCFWGSLYTSLWMALENTLVLALGGAKGLGLFAVAVVLREGICIIPQAVHQVLTPRIIQAYGRDGRLAAAQSLAYRVVPWLTLGMTALVMAASWLLDLLVPVLIPRYADGLLLMKVSLWLGVVQAFSLPINSVIATGKSWSYGRGILGGVFAFPLATYLLAPHVGGVVAVAAGSLVGRVVRTAIGYRDLANLRNREAS